MLQPHKIIDAETISYSEMILNIFVIQTFIHISKTNCLFTISRRIVSKCLHESFNWPKVGPLLTMSSGYSGRSAALLFIRAVNEGSRRFHSVRSSVAKRENVPPTTDTPKNCLPFYGNQIPLHKSLIASYRAVPRYLLFATLVKSPHSNRVKWRS